MQKKIIEIKQAVARHPMYRLDGAVDFEVCEGEQVAIVGDNGAGKSLLVDMITGAHPILDKGDAASYIRYDFSPSESNMVCDNVKYITFQDAYGGTEGNYYYQIRFNQTEFDDKQHLYLLSSGELRRYQLKNALQGNPRVLILDNPFIGLDVNARKMLDETLTQLIKETDMQVVLVLSKTDDIPGFVTHVVEVSRKKVGRKITIEEFKANQQPVPSRLLPKEKEKAILELEAEESDFMNDSDTVIEFNNVCIRYGERTILKDLNLKVRQGEHWALTGENGAGKSTLLSLVCADNPQAYANDIVLFGHKRGSGESIWDIKRNIGYISPEMHRAFLRDYPAIEIVASGLHDSVGLYKKPKPEQMGVCEFWMNIFGVLQYKDTSFLKLSSGEQRLVLLARAFVKDPSLIILDEPLHGLDMKNRRIVKDIIETFCQRKGKTLIMVTHYQEEFPECIDHSIFLKRQK
ncbi:MAG: ATP-binding cassette domain-containing protein [Bacteroidaceae bacterium]|nr:ATP-binding cassette domain-containing protein [Bacteroidaceae bacterium]